MSFLFIHVIIYSFRTEPKGKQKATEQFFSEQLEGVDRESLFAPIVLSQDEDVAMEYVHILCSSDCFFVNQLI